MDKLTIGQLAKITGLNTVTIRFYEKKRLIPDPSRNDSGYRLYTANDVRRIRFIKYAKRLGFSLSEIDKFLSLRIDPNTTCSDIKHYTDIKIAEIVEQIDELEYMKKALTKLSSSCAGKGPVADCPILEAFDNTLKAT
jgi:MerR family mercuric resistance operon transcriptional regulator